MKIILSPAKTMNLKNPIHEDWEINENTQKIVNILKSKTCEELKKLLKISDKLVDENIEYIKNFDKNVSYKAIEMYSGMVYKTLNIESIDNDSLKYLDEHLLILSALYGILKPSSLVKPYRLDFTSNIKVDGKSIKSFWKSYCNLYITEGETVLNLASKEFSELFDKTRYNWHDFDFFEISAGSKKRHSTISKKGRGRLLRSLADSKVKTVEDISKLDGFKIYFDRVL